MFRKLPGVNYGLDICIDDVCEHANTQKIATELAGPVPNTLKLSNIKNNNVIKVVSHSYPIIKYEHILFIL